MIGATGDAEDGLRLEVTAGNRAVFGEAEVGDDEPEVLGGAGMDEKDTLLLDAFDPERDRFLILDKNRDVVPSFFSGFGAELGARAEDGPPETESGVAFPEALFAFAWSLNFFWWSS